ncbi:MAG: Lrp/AsnC ligand binding domain-containing protein [Pseudomonadota bacterium]|nr:Lrp/AsnC ligand binding domain-containing protein [Pseudomonadota bacterium]
MIKRRIVLLDPLKLGLRLTVFVSIEVDNHAAKALAHFAAEIVAMEEGMAVYRMAGDVDYVLRVVVPARRPSTLFTNAWSRQCRSTRLRHASRWQTSYPKPLVQLIAGANRARKRRSIDLQSA